MPVGRSRGNLPDRPSWREDTDDISFDLDFSVPAADLNGGTGQGFGEAFRFSLDAFNWEDVLDNDEVGVITHVQAGLTVYAPVTATEDGTVRGAAVLASQNENIADISNTDGYQAVALPDGTDAEVDPGSVNVNSDQYGRVLHATFDTSFFDTVDNRFAASGPGGKDQMMVPYGLGGPMVTDDEELWILGILEQSKIQDQSIHAEVSGWMHIQKVEVETVTVDL